MKIGIVAGEASGDLLGAGLISALRQLEPNLQVEGIGGTAMAACGCVNLYDSERLAVMGLVESLFRIRELLKIRQGIKQHFLQHPPDVFIGIDAPDFNLGLELALRQKGIPVVHYVSPSVWAWRQKRIHKIAKATDLVLTLFPFEKQFYDRHQVPAHFVGHTLADQIPLSIDKAGARKKLGLDPNRLYIALLPGSRQTELAHMGKTFAKTAEYCWQRNQAIGFITSAINSERDQEFKSIIKKFAKDIPIHFFQSSSHDVMAASDLILVASGTATLESMLYKRPMVIIYQTGFLTYQLARHLVKIPYIGLPNLLANELLVPEFIQKDAKPEKIAAALLDYLAHPDKMTKLQERFTELHEQLGKNASHTAATTILKLLKKM